MDHQPSIQAEQLYAAGMELFRLGQWSEALEIFKQLQVSSDAYPEVDGLIADIHLKLELERLHVPVSQQQPRRARWPFVLAGTIVGLLLIGGVLFATGIVPGQAAPAPTPTRVVRVVTLPTAALTSTPRPSPTLLPTAMPEPTATPEPTLVPTAAPTVVLEPGALIVETANGEQLTRTTGNIALIMDASGSMLASIKQRRKIDMARDALKTLIEQLPDTTRVGLSTYGINLAKGCTDYVQLAPLGQLDRTAMTDLISTVEPAPKSVTPIGFSLQQLASSLKSVQGDTMIVLVSDGEETCKADPAAVAAQIHTDNPLIRIAVIGFDIGNDALRTQLSNIATNGGGPYFDAGDASQLVSALRQAIAISYRVTDSQGQLIYTGSLGSRITLEPGSYKVTIGDKSPLVLDVEISTAQQTAIQVRERNGQIEGSVIAK